MGNPNLRPVFWPPADSDKVPELIVITDQGEEEVLTPDRYWEYSKDAMHYQAALDRQHEEQGEL